MLTDAMPLSADEEEPAGERWGLPHYHTLTVLFAAYAVGMYAKGAMSLGIFGMSKVGLDLISRSLARLRGSPVERRLLAVLCAPLLGALLCRRLHGASHGRSRCLG